MTGATAAPRVQGGWLFAPATDLALILGPLAVALVAHFTLPPGFGSPLWAYVLFVVSFDVAHVWATGYLTYFDRTAVASRRTLLMAIPAVTFAVSLLLHHHSNVLFWTAVAYVAIGHFIKQQIGFVMLYKGLAKRRGGLDDRLDKAAVWMGALGPLALWHATPGVAFEWFGADETFAIRLTETQAQLIVVGMLATQVAWAGRQLWLLANGRAPTVPKVVWVVASWCSWWLGLRVATNFIVATAFINLFHGIPYTALVWWRVSRAPTERAAFIRRWATRSKWVSFYILLVALALVEESLWEAFVWRAYLPELGLAVESVGAIATSAWVALLSLPQITHYVLDGVLWRMTPDNADLRGLVFESAARRSG